MTNENPVIALYGIYNANGGLLGELAYLTGKILGQTHCALCDITHSGISEKADFKACRASLSVPLTTLHINEQEEALAQFTHNRAPCVVGKHQNGAFSLLLDEDALEACHTSVDAFSKALTSVLS